MGESSYCQGPRHNFGNLLFGSEKQATMSEEHFDEFEHYNFDQDKAMRSGQWKAANKERGIDEHKQTQSWRPREEDSDEVDERREEQYEQGRTACGGRQFKKLNPSQPILIVFMYLELNYFDFKVFSEKNSPGRTGNYKKKSRHLNFLFLLKFSFDSGFLKRCSKIL